jgi:hypothetical protein
VVIRRAELELQSGEPLEVGQLLGHAHPAVQLSRWVAIGALIATIFDPRDHPFVFDWATADSAHLFGQRGTQDADFVGESAPDVGLPTGPGLGRGATLLEVISRRPAWR